MRNVGGTPKENTMPAVWKASPVKGFEGVRTKFASFGTKPLNMRALKTILIILLVLLAVGVILGLLGPKDYKIERSTTIAAPADVVYGHIASLKELDKWSPWKSDQHNLEQTFTGNPDGQVGSIMHWKSDESEGEQELSALDPNKQVAAKLHFMKPFDGTSNTAWDLSASGDSTKVTWSMSGENNFVGRIMSTFMNMEKMIGPKFETGLGDLKKMAEADQAAAAAKPKTYGGYEVGVMDRPAQLYAGIRKKIKFSEMHDFFGKNFKLTYDALGKAGIAPGVATGVYFDWDMKTQTTDVMAAVPIPADAKDKVKGVSTYETPASKAYEIVYLGGYANMMAPHNAMDEKMKADGVTMNGNVVEEYVSSPSTEKDSTKWVTNIIYLVK